MLEWGAGERRNRIRTLPKVVIHCQLDGAVRPHCWLCLTICFLVPLVSVFRNSNYESNRKSKRYRHAMKVWRNYWKWFRPKEYVSSIHFWVFVCYSASMSCIMATYAAAFWIQEKSAHIDIFDLQSYGVRNFSNKKLRLKMLGTCSARSIQLTVPFTVFFFSFQFFSSHRIRMLGSCTRSCATAKEEERIMFQQMQAFAQKQVNMTFAMFLSSQFSCLSLAILLYIQWDIYAYIIWRTQLFIYTYIFSRHPLHTGRFIILSPIRTISVCLYLERISPFFRPMLCFAIHFIYTHLDK